MDILAALVIIVGSINLIRLALYLIGSDWYHFLQAKQNRHIKARQLPSITILIPAFNEAATVVRALRSSLRSHYPPHLLHVLVLDNGSTDNTRQLITRYLKNKLNRQAAYLKTPTRGKANALNYALKHFVSTDLVMCLDADSYLHPDTINTIVSYFQNPQVAAVACNVRIIPQQTILNLIQRFEYLICYQMKRAQSTFNIEYIIGGIGSTFRFSVLQKVGFYDTDTITEDIDLTFKLLRQGNKTLKVTYAADALVYTESVLDIPSLMRQRFRWKYGRSQTFYKNVDLFFKNHPLFSKGLTWLNLPFAIFSDLVFFFEPLLVAYIFYVSLFLQDFFTLFSAWLVITIYILLNIEAESTLNRREKLLFIITAPFMYFCFYMLSLVEYTALISSLIHAKDISKSLRSNTSVWKPVARPTHTH